MWNYTFHSRMRERNSAVEAFRIETTQQINRHSSRKVLIIDIPSLNLRLSQDGKAFKATDSVLTSNPIRIHLPDIIVSRIHELVMEKITLENGHATKFETTQEKIPSDYSVDKSDQTDDSVVVFDDTDAVIQQIDAAISSLVLPQFTLLGRLITRFIL